MDIEPSSTPPIAPPTVPTALAVPEPSSVWPTVLGTIAITAGGLGIFYYAYGLVLPHLFKNIKDLNPLLDEFAGRLRLLYVLLFLTAVVVLIGGIGLVRRRAWSVKMLRFWSWFKLGAALISMLILFPMQQRQVALLRTSGNPTLSSGFMATVPWIGACFTVAWYSLLPIIMLIWLSRPRVKTEAARWAA